MQDNRIVIEKLRAKYQDAKRELQDQKEEEAAERTQFIDTIRQQE